MPVLYELDDVVALADRKVTVAEYQRMLTESFDTLRQDGEANGRVMTLNWHPWLVGQPFRVGSVDRALGYIMGQGGVWAATGSEIIDWYQSQSS